MTFRLPGLLQPWGILVIVVVTAIALFGAYRWHRANVQRPPLYLDVAALGLLALLTGGFFWRVLTESGAMMPAGGGDLASLYFPTYSYVAEQIKGGTIPLWNPYIFSGMPMAADVQTGLFYPLNWILYLFVQINYGALEWMLIVHYWLASVFTYLFLRDIGISRLGAIAGGIVFAFCGFMTAHLGHMPMVLVAAWIPLILLLVRRALLRETLVGWAWAVGAGLCMAVAIFAGHVQIFAYGLMASVVLAFYLFFTREASRPESSRPSSVVRRPLFTWIAKGALMLAIALGIGAVQLLPSAEMSSNSSRDKVSYEEASEFPAQPITLLNLVLPRVYGSNPTTYAFGQWQTTENWGYCGVVTLALAVAGVALKRKSMVGFFAIITVISFLIMVGDLSIVSGWLYKFAPGFNKLRDAGRALVLLGLGLSGLAAYGLDALVEAIREGGNRRRALMWWLVGLSAAIVVLLFGIMPTLYKEILANTGAAFGPMPGAINDLGMALLWLGLLAAIGWAAYRGRLAVSLTGGLVLILLVLDLFSPNSRFNPTTENVIAGYQHFDAINLLYKESQDPRTGLPLRVNSDTDVHDVWQPSTAMLSRLLYDTGGAFNPLRPENYEYVWEVAKRNPDSPLYDLTAAGFEVISPTNKHDGQQKWERIERYKEGFEIYRNRNALPRAFLVHEARIEPDRIEGIEVTRRFDVDPRHTVLLPSGQETPSDLKGTAESPQEGEGAEAVRATHYSANRVELEVQVNAPGWVVLVDTWYPGWEATLNSQPVAIEKAFYAYRAVKVGQGKQTIVMQFRPPTWVWGRWLSLLTLAGALVGLVGLFVMVRRRRR
ncbi:MAG TPA: YfhO family protein [Chloroflexia bacterium]|nr:YfhO family protein [Chloroflexia bacterium]